MMGMRVWSVDYRDEPAERLERCEASARRHVREANEARQQGELRQARSSLVAASKSLGVAAGAARELGRDGRSETLRARASRVRSIRRRL